jgi:hypothetical protein
MCTSLLRVYDDGVGESVSERWHCIVYTAAHARVYLGKEDPELATTVPKLISGKGRPRERKTPVVAERKIPDPELGFKRRFAFAHTRVCNLFCTIDACTT